MKLKMNCIKLKDIKIKFLEIICFTNQASRYKQVKAVESIYNHKVKIHEANQEQADLLKYILSFNNRLNQCQMKTKIKK